MVSVVSQLLSTTKEVTDHVVFDAGRKALAKPPVRAWKRALATEVDAVAQRDVKFLEEGESPEVAARGLHRQPRGTERDNEIARLQHEGFLQHSPSHAHYRMYKSRVPTDNRQRQGLRTLAVSYTHLTLPTKRIV